jgi:hypothetical protein
MPENSVEIETLSFKDALNALDAITKDTFVSDVWIPSLNRTISIKEINAKQQKNLLEAAIDSSVYKSSFAKAFYEIITTNISESKEVIDNLTLADKISISVCLRNQIAPTIKVEFTEGAESEDYPLNTIIERVKAYTPPNSETFEITKNGVSVSVTTALPTILSDVQFDTFLLKNKKKTEDSEEVKTIITDAFLGETSKYIKSLSIDGVDLNYSSFSIYQKIQFVEKLPGAIIQQILNIVTKWKKELEDLITVKSLDGEKSKVLELDSLLFLNN